MQRQSFRTTIKNVIEDKKKSSKAQLDFLVPIKSATATEGGQKEKKKKKKSKRIYRTSQNIRIINVFLESLPSESFPRLGITVPGRPSSSVLVSGPVVGAAQVLSGSYSPVFLPPASTALRASAFSSVGALRGLLYTPQTQSRPS